MNQEIAERLQDEYESPYHYGKLQGCTHHFGCRNPRCGDVVYVFLKVEDGKIVTSTYEGSGCVVSQASASLLMQHIDIEHSLPSDEEWLAKFGRLSPARHSCALLALKSAQQALAK